MAPLAVKVVVPPSQTAVGPLIATGGKGLTITVIIAGLAEIHPCELVPDTEYEVVAEGLKVIEPLALRVDAVLAYV